MLLTDKTAVIYGAGYIGSAVARAFARDGAHVFLVGRTLATLDAVAQEVAAAPPAAATAQVDALDQQGIEQHLAGMVLRRSDRP